MALRETGDAQRSRAVTVNGRRYALPTRTTAVICYDGCDPAYVEAARAAAIVPHLAQMMDEGFAAIADAAMPTFTNPNNLSIVCGAPPSVHGISGNYYFDEATGRETMMVDAEGMRAGTILAALAGAGARVAAITAKDKLLKALANDLDGIAFSAERADDATLAQNGIEDVTGLVGRAAPSQYDPDLSLFVLDAGVRLIEAGRVDVAYLSLSDLVQHSHAPGSGGANAFMAAVDQRVGALIAAGATVGIVADHGMNDMAHGDGRARVAYVADALDATFGPGRTRVICPITDPFVRHHGALGGFVRIHVTDAAVDPAAVLAAVGAIAGVGRVLPGAEAAAEFEMPPEREGAAVAIAAPGYALGAHAADHDLSALAGTRLRSHGGLAERRVPFILSRPLNAAYQQKTANLRNYDIFDFALNGVV
ncbi:phosphonoacetate hydrolase [Acuticoccus sp. MNP-M23]|uniref:phosphonoacetate hydrolase n=1 Tax=Acuticoccus sp. MNP-M23 TaxID=3072793 RepID=UPI00281588C2|nr:phosphonoacetate hydrolase [Acuticoccus sp. MNP-M23]WMS41825.1 phosphonoacetate hydrolase [Acuticoccus sp. MNP-M23]